MMNLCSSQNRAKGWFIIGQLDGLQSSWQDCLSMNS